MLFVAVRQGQPVTSIVVVNINTIESNHIFTSNITDICGNSLLQGRVEKLMFLNAIEKSVSTF